MAQNSALKPPAAIVCLAALTGLLLAWTWMHYSPPLVDRFQNYSFGRLATIYYLLVYLPVALIALGLARVCGVQPLRAGPAMGRWTVIGLVAGLGGLGLCALLARINGGMALAVQPAKATGGLLALGLALTLFQVLVEELLFRGWLRLVLRRMIGARWSVILAALAYAGFTMAGSGFAVLPLANLVLLALFLGLLAERSGGIAAPVAAHFGWTALEDLGLGLNPNPGTGPFGAFRDFDLLGAPLWGGTEAGLAASIGMAAVLIAFCLPLLNARKSAIPEAAHSFPE